MSGEKEIEIKRMMQQFEHEISELNSTAISELAGDISKSDFLQLAKAVSIIRAKYLKQVLEIARVKEDELSFNLCLETRKKRIAYEEVIESFDQLKHALERGYFNLVED
jgi:hypothetical protein